jgi:hypothetical protein
MSACAEAALTHMPGPVLVMPGWRGRRPAADAAGASSVEFLACERRRKETDGLVRWQGSAAAGMIGRVFCHPLDTVKARLQASTGVKTSIWSQLRLRGLYRGLGVSMLGSAPATCLYLTSYEVAKDSLAARSELCASYPSLLYLGAGMAAEAFSCVLWVPIDVIKERMQVQQPGGSGSNGIYYRNTLHAARTILRTERLRGLYKGYGATLLSFGPFSALYFMFYEKVDNARLTSFGGTCHIIHD